MNIRSLSTNALLVQDLIAEHRIDFLGLCETWLKPEVYLLLNEATPPNYVNSQQYHMNLGKVVEWLKSRAGPKTKE